jgi:hypothetical protein
MHSGHWRAGLVFALFAAAGLVLGGCGSTENKAGEGKGKSGKEKLAQIADSKEHDHSGWWCDEHGVPEEVCGQCSAKVAAECKKKGDWCKEHDRPDSQCFICHPELKAKFAAQYRAKYGKEPPPTEDEEQSKKNEKK